MVITYHGGSFVKITFGDTTLALDPVSKQSKLKQTRFGADIALISQKHPDANGIENVTHGEREPFVIDGPGEYEVKGITVSGFPSVTRYGGKEMINTIYLISLEGMKLCFLGHMESNTLEQHVREALDDIDILFVPVGADGVFAPSDAHTFAVKLEPHVVIPVLYTDATLKKYLKEEGAEGVKPVEKLTIKKKDVDVKQGEVIILK